MRYFILASLLILAVPALAVEDNTTPPETTETEHDEKNIPDENSTDENSTDESATDESATDESATDESAGSEDKQTTETKTTTSESLITVGEIKQNEDIAQFFRTDRLELLIDALKYDMYYFSYAADTSSGDTILLEQKSTNLVTVDSIGLKIHRGQFVLGFAISSFFSSGSLSAPESGAVHFGYQLSDKLQIGGLLFIDSSSVNDYKDSKRSTSKSKEKGDDDKEVSSITSSNSETERNNILFAAGGWLEYRLSSVWYVQFSSYWVSTSSSQTSMSDLVSPYDTSYGNTSVEIRRQYLRNGLSISPKVAVSESLTYTPRLHISFSAPNFTHTHTTVIDEESESLVFDKNVRVSLSLALASFQYKL